MSESKYSLNPNANSFIPNKKSEALKEMAAKYITDLYEKKKANGETTVTNQEIAKLVWHFISIGYKELTDSDKLRIQSYMNKKLLSSNVPAVRPVSDLAKIRTKLSMKRQTPNHPKESFFASKFQAPKASFLLVAFWGLYRHEQAQRPLLSLTYRPENVKDKIWSVNTSDNKLWNESCVSETCNCPPMFGYSVPSNFFGNLSHLSHTCPIQKIHLNHYPESTEGNEYILTDNWQHCIVDEQPFEDVTVDVKIRVDVNDLKNQFETTISGICNLLSKFADDPENGTEDNEEDAVTHCYTSFWDDIDSKISHVPFSQQNRDSLVDDNDHPLLKISDICGKEEVPLEVKEMIRKSLSPKKDEISNDINDMNEEIDIVCDPPCSIWCGSEKKKHIYEEIVHAESTQEPNNFEDAPAIDLISLDKLDSKEKVEPVNIELNPVRNFCGNEIKTRQRFFSVDGSDPFYNEDFTGVTAHASNWTMPKNTIAFLKDPVNFLKTTCRINSWDDTDSGFVSPSSSQEDIFGGKDEPGAHSTWEIVSGKDSLWKPLPECTETNDRMPFSHKQARNFRRPRSES